jgi:hypothetical protein
MPLPHSGHWTCVLDETANAFTTSSHLGLKAILEFSFLTCPCYEDNQSRWKLAVLINYYGMVCGGIALAGFPGWAAGWFANGSSP